MAVPRPFPAGSMSLRDLAGLIGARAAPTAVRDLAGTVSGVCLDSRQVLPNDLYAALPGANTHGARFVAQALGSGASAVLTDRRGAEIVGSCPVPVLIVDDPRAALGIIASHLYGTRNLPLDLVGITGTNGKTTTAYLLTSALDALGHRTGLIGTVETRIGSERIASVRTTPEATDLHALLGTMVRQSIDTCVMEVSSHALALNRVDAVVYDLAIFTNLSQDHLDFHHDMASYFIAKASLFAPERARRGLICVDDAWGQQLAAVATIPVATLTSVPGRAADWRVAPIGSADPAAFTLSGPGDVRLQLRSALVGDFNLVNTALAAAALIELGHTPADVARAVLTDPHVPGRMERVRIADGGERLPRVVVDFAHTPEAIRAAVRALRPTTPGRLVVVTGAGGDRDRDKRQAMGAAAAAGDVVVVTDDNPRSEDPRAIREAVLAGARGTARDGGPGPLVLEVGDRHEAIRVAVEVACGLDPHPAASGTGPSTVLIVGKGHETGQEVAGAVLPFDDRIEGAAALRAVLARLGRARERA